MNFQILKITTKGRFPPIEEFKNTKREWSITKVNDEFLQEYAVSNDKKVYKRDTPVMEIESDWSFFLVASKETIKKITRNEVPEKNEYALIFGDSPLHEGYFVVKRGKGKFDEAVQKFEEFVEHKAQNPSVS